MREEIEKQNTKTAPRQQREGGRRKKERRKEKEKEGERST